MMNYSNMIEEKNLKKTFIIATLISTIIGTFTTSINLYERLEQQRKQKKTDKGQNDKIKRMEDQIKELEGKRESAREDSRREVRDEDAEHSLREGGPLIRREYDRDMRRFGERFAVGDAITQNQLQGQVITLQSTVIGLLQDALYTGRISDVNKLYNASELAREGSIAALQQQYQRMLEAAPLRRPPGMHMRRISSTPTLKSLPPPLRDGGKSTANGEEYARTERNSALTNGTPDALDIDPDGPLFCIYSLDLQSSPSQTLAASLARPASSGGPPPACPACRAALPLAPGRAWKIAKEIQHSHISTPAYDEHVLETRSFLLSNRFVVKCHRPAPLGGFACTLCTLHREADTICESVEGLVRHVWIRHAVEEYARDPDIREVATEIEEVRERERERERDRVR